LIPNRIESVVAPPRSLYRKIQRVLEEARKEKAESKEDLVELISKRGHLDFTYLKSSPGGGAKPAACKLESIRHIIEMCALFGLMDQEEFRLTPRGLRALESPTQFDRELRHALLKRLEQIGAPMALIHDTITRLLLDRRGNILPTWDAIYGQLNLSPEKCAKHEFHQYLSLLSACKGISSSRKKIYLP
jgi:hypothetical protein